MKQRIIYSSSGERRYEIDGKEVTEAAYKVATSAADREKLLDMLDAGVAPHGVTDTSFMAGTENGRQFAKTPAQGNYYRRIAEAHGGRTKGKKYLSGLARFPGDPEAWVDGRGEAQRLLEQRGWGSEGTVNVKKREPLNPPESGPKIAEDLVNKYANRIAAAHGGADCIDMDNLKDQVRERHGNKRKKKEATKADRG